MPMDFLLPKRWKAWPFQMSLLQMDLERKSDLETASGELKRAERARNLPKLCEALDKAFACHLDDPLLEELQERRLKLVDAEESLERAKADVNRLGPSSERCHQKLDYRNGVEKSLKK